MPDDRWTRVASVFHEALRQPPEARSRFLDRACADHPEDRAEVESLLAHHRAGDVALESGGSLLPADLLDADPESLVGRRLGAYRVERELGRGGMGVVYLAEDERLGRRVALKALPPGRLEDPARRERLRREARALAALSHPGIAIVHALEEIQGHVYLVSEFVEGDTLRTVLRRGPLPVREAVDVLRRIVEAVAAAHDRGIVHRDLKPENVVRTPGGGVKVLDFGLAISPSSGAAFLPRLTEEGAVAGTPGYMAPEQRAGLDVDARADVYALGLMLHELVTGRLPFDPASVTASASRVAGAGLRVPRALQPVIARCLSPDPVERFQTAGALGAALRPLGNEEDLEAEAVPVRTASARFWWRMHQGVVCGVSAAVLPVLWATRAPPGTDVSDRTVFLVGLGIAAAVVSLRLHLWFTSWFDAPSLRGQIDRSSKWIRALDVAFALVLLVAAALLIPSSTGRAGVLLVVAVALTVASWVIEPATTKALLRRP